MCAQRAENILCALFMREHVYSRINFKRSKKFVQDAHVNFWKFECDLVTAQYNSTDKYWINDEIGLITLCSFHNFAAFSDYCVCLGAPNGFLFICFFYFSVRLTVGDIKMLFFNYDYTANNTSVINKLIIINAIVFRFYCVSRIYSFDMQYANKNWIHNQCTHYVVSGSVSFLKVRYLQLVQNTFYSEISFV